MQDTLFSTKYWLNLDGHVMAVKMFGSDAKHQYKQTKSAQINKKDTNLKFLLQLCASSTGTQVYL